MASTPITVTATTGSSSVNGSVKLVESLPQAIPIEEASGIYNGSEINTESKTQSHPEPQTELKPNHLITSPYTTPEHHLDLSNLDPQSRLLAQALTKLSPTRPDYATAPYTESFNWPIVFETLRDLAKSANHVWTKRSFYVVVFRSILRSDADVDLLYKIDERSHAEAVASGGLLKYWYGVRNEREENLATCVWRSREDARLGGTGPWHQRARGAAKDMYVKIVFPTFELVVDEGVKEWEFRDWVHG